VHGFANPDGTSVSFTLRDLRREVRVGALWFPADDEWVWVEDLLRAEWDVDFGDWSPAILSLDDEALYAVGELYIGDERMIGFRLRPKAVPEVTQIIRAEHRAVRPGRTSRISVGYSTS